MSTIELVLVIADGIVFAVIAGCLLLVFLILWIFGPFL